MMSIEELDQRKQERAEEAKAVMERTKGQLSPWLKFELRRMQQTKSRPDYSQSKIYIITSTATDKCLIGSTTSSLNERMRGHVASALDGTTPFHMALRKLGANKFTITMIKNYPCSSRKMLKEEEESIIHHFRKKVKLYNE